MFIAGKQLNTVYAFRLCSHLIQKGGFMKFNFKEYIQKRSKKKENGVKALEGFRQYMLEKGFKYLVVYYEGCGDSGETFDIEGHKTNKSLKEAIYSNDNAEYIKLGDWKDGKFIKIPEKEAYEKGTRNQYTVLKALREWNEKTGENLEPYKITDTIDYDWYNGEGGSGKVVFDLEDGKLDVVGRSYTRAFYNINEIRYTDDRPSKYYYDDTIEGVD